MLFCKKETENYLTNRKERPLIPLYNCRPSLENGTDQLTVKLNALSIYQSVHTVDSKHSKDGRCEYIHNTYVHIMDLECVNA